MMRHTVSCLIMLITLPAISFGDSNDKFTFPLQIGNKWFLHGSEPGVYDHEISYQVVDTARIAGVKYYDIEPGLFATDGLYRVDSLLNFIQYSGNTEIILGNFSMQENDFVVMNTNEEIPDTAICTCLYRYFRRSIFGTDNLELKFGLNWSMVTTDLYMYLNVMDNVGLSGIGKVWYDKPYVLFGAKIGGQFYGDSVATTIYESERGLPSSFRINNYPNPFNPTTTISFDLPKEGMVTLKFTTSLAAWCVC